MNRCFNDIFGYCSGEPEGETTTVKRQYLDMGGKLVDAPITISTCNLDPKTCGFYRTQSQLQKVLEAQHA